MIISKIGKAVTGKTPSTKHSDNWSEDKPFYTPEDIAKGYILDDATRHISNKGFQSIKNNTVTDIIQRYKLS